jgi:cytochrome oxidase Cu insertion factor (SCO1/SenC/PrrC family)
MQAVLSALGDAAGRVQVLFVTLDPARDSAQLLAEYVTAFHPSFIGLHGDEATTAAVAKDFKVFYARQAGTTPAVTASTTPRAAMSLTRRVGCGFSSATVKHPTTLPPI